MTNIIYGANPINCYEFVVDVTFEKSNTLSKGTNYGQPPILGEILSNQRIYRIVPLMKS